MGVKGSMILKAHPLFGQLVLVYLIRHINYKRKVRNQNILGVTGQRNELTSQLRPNPYI